SGELGDLADDVRRLFQELGHASARASAAVGDCVPPLDVLETDEAVQVLMDLPGVPLASVKVLLKGDVVLVVGEKWAGSPGVRTGGYPLAARGLRPLPRTLPV